VGVGAPHGVKLEDAVRRKDLRVAGSVPILRPALNYWRRILKI